MAGFKEAQTNPLIDTSGKKHVKLAVAAVTEVELTMRSSLKPMPDVDIPLEVEAEDRRVRERARAYR